jgi:Na+/proline symporter
MTGVLIILAMLTAYVAAQLNAAGKTFNGTFGWSYLTGVLVGAAIVLGLHGDGRLPRHRLDGRRPGHLHGHYGDRAPCDPDLEDRRSWTPSGMSSQPRPTAAALTDPFGGRAGLALIGFLASVAWRVPLGNPGQPHVLVRLMAVKDKAAVLRGGVISSLWVLLLFSGAVVLGMAARRLFRRDGRSRSRRCPISPATQTSCPASSAG